MLTKTQLLQTIKNLPEKFSVDELFDRIMLIEKIEVGLEQSHLGQTLTTNEAQEKLGKWLK